MEVEGAAIERGQRDVITAPRTLSNSPNFYLFRRSNWIVFWQLTVYKIPFRMEVVLFSSLPSIIVYSQFKL